MIEHGRDKACSSRGKRMEAESRVGLLEAERSSGAC